MNNDGNNNEYDPSRPSAVSNPSNKSWHYRMRRSKQQILPGLYLGPYAAAMKSCRKELLDDGITHIVCCRSESESKFIRPNFPNDFHYLILSIEDSWNQPMIMHFKQVYHFITDALASGGRVFVHGNVGISRSATLVISYVMAAMNLSACQAISFVLNKRFCIFPNQGFERQLREYEPILRAQPVSFSGNGLKRSYELIEKPDENNDLQAIDSSDTFS